MRIEPEAARTMIGTLRGAGERGPWRPLLAQVLRLAGPGAQILCSGEKPWASATFSGSRHKLVLAFDGEAAVALGETFIAALPDHEFHLRDHLVADATITAVEHSLVNGPRMIVDAEILVLDDA